MKVAIKVFDVDMQVKNNGIEFEVRDNNDDHLGDFYLTKANLIWCNGRTQKKNGKKVSWDEFIQWMNSKP